jgi:exopolyphosphatase / guanosine-5'-triphosphate,3'-diphosphate pyrophosphatase
VRVAVLDLGSNSSRLLIADVDADGRITERHRDSRVTRLAQQVQHTGVLADEAMDRVFAVLSDFRATMDEHAVEASTAVLTSAVRDAANGAAFAEQVTRRFGVACETLAGDEEARLSFLGATGERPHDGTPLVVMDIGGGSTEFVCGRDGHVDFRVSTQVGVVRHTERHVTEDPPAEGELASLREDAAATYAAAVPAAHRDAVREGIAVAGTATSAAAIVQELEPYDPFRVHGFRLLAGHVDEVLARLAQLDEAERREVPGLHPDRAPTILAGMVLLQTAMRTFGLDEVTVSEHDILRGALLKRAGLA